MKVATAMAIANIPTYTPANGMDNNIFIALFNIIANLFPVKINYSPR